MLPGGLPVTSPQQLGCSAPPAQQRSTEGFCAGWHTMQVRNELAATQEELREARVAIQERDFAIATQKQCEQALAAHAAELNRALAAAAADISLLFKRVDEKNELEDGNLTVVQQLRETAVVRLGAVEAAISSTAAAQGARFAEARSLLSSFVERKAADAARLQQQLAALQGQLDAVSADAQVAAAALQMAGAEGLQALGSQQAAYLAAARAAAEEASSSIGAAYTALAASAAVERVQLDGLMQEQAAATQAVNEATATIVSAVREQLQKSEAAAEAAREDLTGRLQEQAGGVSAFEEAFLATVRADQAALLQQIGSMLGGFVDKTGQEVSVAMAGLRARIASDQASLAEQLGGIAGHANDSLVALASNETTMQAAAASAAQVLQDGGARLGAAIEAAEQQGSGLHAAVQAAATATAGQLDEHSAAAGRLVAQGVQVVGDLAAAAQNKARTAAAAVTAARQALEEGVQADIEQDKGTASQLGSLTVDGAAAVAAFGSEQAAAVVRLSGTVQTALDRQYQKDTKRGREELLMLRLLVA